MATLVTNEQVQVNGSTFSGVIVLRPYASHDDIETAEGAIFVYIAVDAGQVTGMWEGGDLYTFRKELTAPTNLDAVVPASGHWVGWTAGDPKALLADAGATYACETCDTPTFVRLPSGNVEVNNIDDHVTTPPESSSTPQGSPPSAVVTNVRHPS